MIESMTRRGFVSAMGMAGALGALGASVKIASADEAAPQYDPEVEVTARPGADKPWSGPGSANGDWTATPTEIAKLGGSTMPLDELNRRRKMYVESFGEYVMADGTVVPAVYNQMRALCNTYSWGVGSTPADYSFSLFIQEVTEEQAQAFLDMPWGKYFRAIDLYAKGGRTFEECEEVCEFFAEKGYLRRNWHSDGIMYNMSGWFEGIGGYLMNDVSMGDPAYEWPIGGDFESMAEDWANAGTPVFHSVPCDRSVTTDGEVLAYDDIEALIMSNTQFALTPCSCRYGMLIAERQAAGEDYPTFAEFGTGEYEDTFLEDGEGPRVETCICVGDEAGYWVDHGTARAITKEEALERIRRSREEGFIIECTREGVGEYICSCRSGYCNVMAFWESLKEMRGSMDKVDAFDRVSDYVLEVDYDKCVKCGTCERRCPGKVITMDGEYNGETGYPQVADLCYKCGQCAYVCPMEARKLALRPEEERLPIMPDNLVDDYNLKAAYRFEQGMVY